MTSVRLPKELENKLELLAKEDNITKSDVIKKALDKYFDEYDKKLNPYDLGEELFGKHGSGDGSLSETYKTKLRGKINEKMSH